jgi:hypothetical protein
MERLLLFFKSESIILPFSSVEVLLGELIYHSVIPWALKGRNKI